MSIRRQRGFLKRQADAQRSLLDGSQQGTLRVATPYKVTAGRRGVLAAGGNADAGAHLHLTAQPATAVAAGATYNVSWNAQNPEHPPAGYAETALTLPVTAVPVVVAGYYDIDTAARFDVALNWSVKIVVTRNSADTVVWPPTVIPQVAAFTAAVGTVHVPAVELLAGDTVTMSITNNSGAAGTVEAAHLALSLVDRSRGVVTDPPVVLWAVAVGDGGVIATSTDNGATWTSQTNPLSGTGLWTAVARNATSGRRVAGGQSSSAPYLAMSDDGTNWTAVTSPFASGGYVGGIAHGGGLWIAGTMTGLDKEYATSPDGVTWTAGTNPLGSGTNIRCAAYGGGQFIVAGDAGKLATSPDGTTWTLRTSTFGTSDYITDVAYNGSGLWVAVGNAGKLATSPDGVTWTAQSSGFGTSSIQGVRHDQSGLWVIVGWNSKISTSPDGVTWTPQTSPFAGMVLGLIHRNGVWAAGTTSGEIATSPDGAAWTLASSPFGTNAVYDFA